MRPLDITCIGNSMAINTKRNGIKREKCPNINLKHDLLT